MELVRFGKLRPFAFWYDQERVKELGGSLVPKRSFAFDWAKRKRDFMVIGLIGQNPIILSHQECIIAALGVDQELML